MAKLTTDQIRFYVMARFADTDPEYIEELGQAFDEWLRQVKSDAWWRGARTILGLTGTHPNLTNPYEWKEEKK